MLSYTSTKLTNLEVYNEFTVDTGSYTVVFPISSGCGTGLLEVEAVVSPASITGEVEMSVELRAPLVPRSSLVPNSALPVIRTIAIKDGSTVFHFDGVTVTSVRYHDAQLQHFTFVFRSATKVCETVVQSPHEFGATPLPPVEGNILPTPEERLYSELIQYVCSISPSLPLPGTFNLLATLQQTLQGK